MHFDVIKKFIEILILNTKNYKSFILNNKKSETNVLTLNTKFVVDLTNYLFEINNLNNGDFVEFLFENMFQIFENLHQNIKTKNVTNANGYVNKFNFEIELNLRFTFHHSDYY
jgi:hypothetical protein